MKQLKSGPFIRFLIAGASNTLISNYILLLLLSFAPIGAATLASQAFHAFGGYLASKYGIFKRKGRPIQYAFLVLFSWINQWFILKIIINLGVRPVFAICIIIPILAITSFLIQKNMIFK